MVDIYSRQILHLLFGDVESDAIVDLDDSADGDGHLFASPQMSFLEKHVDYMVIPRIHDQPLNTSDSAVRGIDLLAPPHSHLKGVTTVSAL
jgi:hypothetical protein